MTTTLKHLLSDKFVEFSTEIANVHNEIKELTTEFQTKVKELTTEFQAKVKELRNQADVLRSNFETWEQEQESKTPLEKAVNTEDVVTTTKTEPTPVTTVSSGRRS